MTVYKQNNNSDGIFTVLAAYWASVLLLGQNLKARVMTTLSESKERWADVIQIAVVNAHTPLTGARTVYRKFYSGDAVQRATLTDAVIGMFVFAMVLVACYLALVQIEPYLLTGDADKDADIIDTLDKIKVALGIASIVVIFIALGLLIGVLRSW